MALLPVALYGLEVPAGEIVEAVPDFPATFRITMAAIDPITPVEINEKNFSAPLRATLKLIRLPSQGEDESDDEDYDDEEMQKLLAGLGSDDESESDDEEANGGPSDPAKSKKAQKEAAVKKLLENLKSESDEEMDDAVVNGLSAKAKGKAKAAAVDESDDDDSEESEGLEVEEFVVCTLDTERNFQQPLDITINEGEKVFFKVVGMHAIHLTGNYVVPNDHGHNDHHEVYDSEEEDEYDLSPSEDEESDELDGLEDPRITELDDDNEPAPKLVSKPEKKGKNKRSADALEDAESLDALVSKSIKEEESKESLKLSKKQLKKLKNNKGNAVEVKAEAKEDVKDNGKGDKKVQFAKNLEQGPTGSTPEKAASKKATDGVKVVNGVKIEDKKIGEGPAAKAHHRVEMRYIGKLDNGKVFDSNKKGKPFAFKIGSGEVIKGMEIGVTGMRIGGERRITIPPSLGYGSKSMGAIPKNSNLIFEIKMLRILS